MLCHCSFILYGVLLSSLYHYPCIPCYCPFTLCRCPFTQILSEGHLLLALFSFVRANDKQTGPREWTAAQFEELQLQAMASLCTLCPLMLEDYMTCQGSTRLLLLLEWCVGPGQCSVCMCQCSVCVSVQCVCVCVCVCVFGFVCGV